MNSLNSIVIKAFNYEFEWQCMSLLSEAYDSSKSKYNIIIDYEEENISAVLFDYIDNCSQAAVWNIHISDEFRRYNKSILQGKKPAKSAPRIDLRFGVWKNNIKLTYFVEAKNLIETDSSKKGKKSKISAAYLRKRYVETGIDNYVSGRYPLNGCLVGYVLQGNTENIIKSINCYLQDCSRSSEILTMQSFGIQNLNSTYLSKHNNNMTIKHLILDFTVQ